MKIQLENITNKVNRSFTTMFNPRLNDLFFWHFHPEYELVYIEGASGTRHIGDHNSNYEGSDLVLIGSNIPHLNFDYGVKTDYTKAVIHFKKEFIESKIQNVPELSAINKLFVKSKFGIAFHGKRKDEIGRRLFELENLDAFKQYILLIEILQEISTLEKRELLHEQAYDIRFNNKEQGRLNKIYAFVDKNYQRKIELSEVAQISNMTKEAFCRYFKKMTTYTFIEFLNRYRISQSKRYLMSKKSISDACYASGFESLSYYNRIFKKVTNENPSAFRKRYL